MRVSFVSLLFVLVTAASLGAADIPPEEAGKRAGEKITVLEGKEVSVAGTVEPYKDKPAIVLSASGDLKAAERK